MRKNDFFSLLSVDMCSARALISKHSLCCTNTCAQLWCRTLIQNFMLYGVETSIHWKLHINWLELYFHRWNFNAQKLPLDSSRYGPETLHRLRSRHTVEMWIEREISFLSLLPHLPRCELHRHNFAIIFRHVEVETSMVVGIFHIKKSRDIITEIIWMNLHLSHRADLSYQLARQLHSQTIQISLRDWNPQEICLNIIHTEENISTFT